MKRFGYQHLLLICFALVPLCSAQQTPSTLNIAVIGHGDWRDPNDVFANPMSYSVVNLRSFFRGTQVWESMINEHGGIPTYDDYNTRVPVKLQYFNIGNTTSTVRAQRVADKLMNGTYGNISAIIAPGFSLDDIVVVFLRACEISKTCLTVVPLTPSSAVFVCTEPLPSDCRRAGSRRFQYGYSVLYDGNFALSAHLSLYRQHSLSNIAVLYSSLSYGVQASAATQDTAFSLGLKVVDARMFHSTIPWTKAEAEEVIRNWKANNVQGVCILSNGADTVALNSIVTLVEASKTLNWLPSAIALGGAIGTNLATRLGAADFAYMMTAAQWDWHLKGRQYQTINSTFNLELFPATNSLSSPAVFRDTMIERTGEITDGSLVYAADAVQALTFIQKFIESGNGAWDVESMRAISRQVSTPSITGQLQMDAYGRTVVSDQLVFQALPNGNRLINSPLSIGVAAIIPMPQWDQREFHGKFYSTSLEQAGIAMNTILYVYSTLLAIGFLLFRKHPVMKAATPLFCILIILGGNLMQASIYATGLFANDASCHAQYWLLTMGFSLMFGALFMKTWRVVRIFDAGKNLKKVAISNSMLLVMLACLMSFDLILNTIASASDLFQAKYVIADEHRLSLNYFQCEVDDGARVFFILTAAEKGFLILAGISLTIAARNVPSRFNETPYLAAAIYNCALLCAFAVAIVATGIGGRDVGYAVQVFGIEILVFSTLTIVFIPKFYLLFGNGERLKELEKLNEQFTNTDSVGSNTTWKQGSKRDPTTGTTKTNSVRPQPSSNSSNNKASVSGGSASSADNNHKSSPSIGSVHSAAMGVAPVHRPSFPYSSRATIMRGPNHSPTVPTHELTPTHPFEAASTELVEIPNVDEFATLIPTASNAALLSHSAQLSAKLETIQAMLSRVHQELEQRQGKPSSSEMIAPVTRLATGPSYRVPSISNTK